MQKIIKFRKNSCNFGIVHIAKMFNFKCVNHRHLVKVISVVWNFPGGRPGNLWSCRPCGLHLVKLNTLRPRQNGRHFADDTFKPIFLNETIRILIKISLKFVPKGLINNIPALVLIMAWHRPGDKPLSEAMLVRSLKHICVTRPQWVKVGH